MRSNPAPKPTDRHLLAVATQRTSYAISGPYQDVLEWAHRAESGVQFFARLDLPGVASEEMCSFAKSFRSNLVVQGVADEDEAVWSIIRRFMILEFDFESEEQLDPKAFGDIMGRMVYTGKEPLGDEIIAAMIAPPSILKRRATVDRVLAGMKNYLQTFEEAVGDLGDEVDA